MQFSFLVLTVWLALCAGTIDAHALSASCSQISSDWGTGRTLTTADGTSQFYREYDSLDVGETVTWSAVGSGTQGSPTYANYYVGNFDDWDHHDATTTNANISDAGTYTFSAGRTFAAFEVVVNKSASAPDVPVTMTLTVSCSAGAPVTITLSPAAGSLANGEVGTAYSQTFSASGGAGPYTYAVTSGALPDGLTLASNGALTGTPTTAETANFTVTATDANSDTGNAAYSIQVDAAPVVIALTPAAGSLANGEVGTAYSQTFSASGGTGPIPMR